MVLFQAKSPEKDSAQKSNNIHLTLFSPRLRTVSIKLQVQDMIT